MYLLLNNFSFTEPRETIQSIDVIEALENLGKLFIELKKMNIDIIIFQLLSQTTLISKPIREYLLSLENVSTRQALAQLFGKTRPFCSDLDTAFEADEIISYSNCKEEIGNIDVLYTFFSCAMYYDNPILTVNNLCNKKQFLETKIKIVCDNNIEYKLDNYQLIPYQTVIGLLSGYQKEQLLDEYNLLNNWDDYQKFINENFQFSKITQHCINQLKKRCPYKSSYAIDFREKVKRIDLLVQKENRNIKAIDFNHLSKKHYSPESLTRFNSLKRSYPNIKNYQGEQVYLNWHTWVQDFRMYFEKEDDYISYVHFEKKIDK